MRDGDISARTMWMGFGLLVLLMFSLYWMGAIRPQQVSRNGMPSSSLSPDQERAIDELAERRLEQARRDHAADERLRKHDEEQAEILRRGIEDAQALQRAGRL